MWTKLSNCLKGLKILTKLNELLLFYTYMLHWNYDISIYSRMKKRSADYTNDYVDNSLFWDIINDDDMNKLIKWKEVKLKYPEGFPSGYFN